MYNKKIRPLALTLTALAVLALAQSAGAQSFTRPTVTRVLVNHKDGEDNRIAADFAQIPKEERFFYNNTATITAVTSVKPRNNISKSSDGKEYLASLDKVQLKASQDELTALLSKSDLGLQQLSKWFNRKADGTMDMDLIHFRGEYNATDEALYTASATKRGREELRDQGEKLIANTYLLVFDYTNVKYEHKDGYHNWNTDLYLHVFRLAQVDKLVSAVYDCWIDEGDSPEVRRQKIAKFEDIKVSFELEQTLHKGAGSMGASSGQSAVSSEVVYRGMVRRGYENPMESLAKKDDRFSAVAPVYSTSPITAKIGLKEDVKSNQRYIIYESVMKRSGTVKRVRRGVARANGEKIANNLGVTTGSTTPSEFYQISGAYVEPGMTLLAKDDLGLALTLGGGASSGGQVMPVHARLDWMLKMFASPNTWTVFAEFEYLMGSYETPLLGEIDLTKLPVHYVLSTKHEDGQKRDIGFGRFTLGLSRNYQPLRNLQVSPYFGFGLGASGFASFKDSTAVESSSSGTSDSESSDKDKLKDFDISAWHAKLGVNLAVNLYYPLQLVGGAYVYAHSAYASEGTKTRDRYEWKDKDKDPFAKIRDKRYDEYYKGLKPYGVVGFVGLRYTF